ncbi:hypothetical protein C1X72_02365 [Pseudomonas sp. FW306-2-2C-D06B]|nr:hypothetical protein C1X72_02365 [Pseudomonas sp. FW306-2-2C-D06B]PNA93114.1 hypothetical protein C1X74_21850 [Pseudomonas sp. GW460-5]PNB55596.1 hypothetical protein C1X73_21875 [Pseudomonas sp. FW305-130]PYG96185.1 hypothetical protein CVV67_35045 [Arthrobacter stackebrandtii]
MLWWLYGLLRGHARSRRACVGLEGDHAPVGAGVPAKGPLQVRRGIAPSAPVAGWPAGSAPG